MIANSNDGFFRRSMCFNNRALSKAVETPIAADAKNIKQKRLIPVKIASDEDMSGLFDSKIEVVRTIAMASFRILSPKTNMLRTGSIFKAWKMATVATGSTAEIRDPKAKLSINDNL